MIRRSPALAACAALFVLPLVSQAADTPVPTFAKAKAVKLFEVPHYCEGVVFDHHGLGYVSEGDTIVRFSPEGKTEVWAKTGSPNGHRVLADGTHLVCDGSHHAVLHLDQDGKMLEPASKECDGKELRAPNDLTLDSHGGFYFTDPGGSSDKEAIGTVHYVDKSGKTKLIDKDLAFPNGTAITPDGKRLYVGESKKNRILVYAVSGPGQVGDRKELIVLPTKDEKLGQIDNQPDGMCLDAAGNLYVAHYGMQQVEVVSPAGKLIARLPGGNVTTSNVAFGGPNHDQLFVTGGLAAEGGKGGVFRLDLKTKGLVILPAAKK